MGYNIYDANGNLTASGGFAGNGGGGGGGTTLTYDRMDVGILLLNQQFLDAGVYDFRVPGDGNNNTFKYRMPRAGVLFGVSMTGTVSTTIQGGNFVQATSAASGTASDIMQPSDAGNTQTYVPATFQQKGSLILAPSPISLQKDDLIAMKFWANQAVTVSLSGFLIIGLTPQ